MNMKGGKTIAGLMVYAVLTAVFGALAFIIPFVHSGLFWTGFAFGVVALIVSMLIITIAAAGKKTAVGKLYSFPIGRVGVIYTAAQLVLSFTAMGLAAVGKIPAWPFMAASMILLAAAVIMTIIAVLTRSVINRQELSFKEDVASMEGLRSAAAALPEKCVDAETKKALVKLADALRFSDPVTNAATKEKEAELAAVVDEIGERLSRGENEGVISLCEKAEEILAERNRLCKLNK